MIRLKRIFRGRTLSGIRLPVPVPERFAQSTYHKGDNVFSVLKALNGCVFCGADNMSDDCLPGGLGLNMECLTCGAKYNNVTGMDCIELTGYPTKYYQRTPA